MKRYIPVVLCMGILLAGPGACTKRLDEPILLPPGTPNNIPGSASALRLVNVCFGSLADYSQWQAPDKKLDVSVNGRKLTTFLNYYNETEQSVSPTPWFPKGFLNFGDQFTIPDSLLDARGNGIVNLYSTGEVIVSNRQQYADTSLLRASLSLHSDPANPLDVYIYDSGAVKTLTFPRSAFPASRPDYFKIRVINLNNHSTRQSFTLSYANGTPVDPKTTGIAYRSAGSYVELPYGTYQFKLTDQGGNPINQNGNIQIDPATGGLATTTPPYTGNGLTYNPLRTFKPGGIYTIVIHNTVLNDPSPYVSVYDTLPVYSIIPDNNPAPAGYIQLMGANALSGQGSVHFVVDGQSLGNNLGFGQFTAYSRFGAGPHTAQAFDASGGLLASASFNSLAMDNWTLWAYRQDGEARILVTGNDMSMGSVPDVNTFGYVPAPILLTALGWQCRFLNLSGDIPYAVFYDQTGNFMSGINPVSGGYDSLSVTQIVNHTGLFQIDLLPGGVGPIYDHNMDHAQTLSVYSGAPGQLPGADLGLRLDRPFVANTAFYHFGNGNIPSTEPGSYSIALIGNATGKTDADRLKLVVIKHNQ